MDAHTQRAGGGAVLGSARPWVVDGVGDVPMPVDIVGKPAESPGERLLMVSSLV